MSYLLEWLLGSPGRSIVAYLETHPLLWTITIGVWFLFYLIGRLQLYQIRKKTDFMVVNEARQLLSIRPNTTANGIYKRVFPKWKSEVKKWAWYVPNRLEIFPVSSSPDNVLLKFSFTPDWVRICLRKNGIQLQETGNTIPEE